jgi:hypothetical protein
MPIAHDGADLIVAESTDETDTMLFECPNVISVT